MTDDTAQNASSELQSLLPFYVNGTLSAQDRLLVEKNLSENAQYARDYEALVALRRNMQSDDTSDTQAPAELGWARLEREIDAEPRPVANLTRAPRFKSGLRMGILAASACLFGYTLATFNTAPAPNPSAAGLAGTYLPASGISEIDLTGSLRVIFAADATVNEINALLLDAGLEIVQGPSALGFYYLKAYEGDGAALAADLSGDLRIDSIEVVEE